MTSGGSERDRPVFEPKLFQEAMTSNLQKMMREELGSFKEQVEEMSSEVRRMRVRVDRVVSTQIELSEKSRSAQRSERSHPRKDRVEDEWDPGIANRRNGGRFKEVRVREDNNMGCIKKKSPLNNPEEWRELGKIIINEIESFLFVFS